MRTETERFLRFLIVGSTAAIVNIVSRIALSQAMIFEAAVLLAYLIAMVAAFLLNRRFVFEPSGRSIHDEVLRFVLVNMVAAAQVWIVSVGLARFLFPAIGFTWNAETVAHVIGVASPIFTSYFGHKHVSFGVKR